jgi:hypothetical protein
MLFGIYFLCVITYSKEIYSLECATFDEYNHLIGNEIIKILIAYFMYYL